MAMAFLVRPHIRLLYLAISRHHARDLCSHTARKTGCEDAQRNRSHRCFCAARSEAADASTGFGYYFDSTIPHDLAGEHRFVHKYLCQFDVCITLFVLAGVSNCFSGYVTVALSTLCTVTNVTQAFMDLLQVLRALLFSLFWSEPVST